VPPVVHSAPDVVEYVRRVEELSVASDRRPLWFRGVGDSSFNLVPSLYRDAGRTAAELIEIERRLLTMFRQRSAPYYPRPGTNDWDYFFLMQHYGVPTRLLDWSENALVALYFAILDAEKHRGASPHFVRSASIWVLDPQLWNEHALRESMGKREVLSTDDDVMKSYVPTSVEPLTRQTPLAMYGTHTNIRIVAQRGTFVVFGASGDSMETHFDAQAFPPVSLRRIDLSPAMLNGARAAVDALGFTESMIYPDLEGLARELTREFGLTR
jgi:hypothetical protein